MKHKVKAIHFIVPMERSGWHRCAGRSCGNADWQSHET